MFGELPRNSKKEMPRISLPHRLKSYGGNNGTSTSSNGTNYSRGKSISPHPVVKRSSTMDLNDSRNAGLVLKVVALKVSPCSIIPHTEEGKSNQRGLLICVYRVGSESCGKG